MKFWLCNQRNATPAYCIEIFSSLDYLVSSQQYSGAFSHFVFALLTYFIKFDLDAKTVF